MSLIEAQKGCRPIQLIELNAQPAHAKTIRRTMMIKNFLRDESGLELSEYAVAAALIAIAVVAAFTLLGTNIGNRINELANTIGS
jgi:pilus assembly protein Flp/PilA